MPYYQPTKYWFGIMNKMTLLDIIGKMTLNKVTFLFNCYGWYLKGTVEKGYVKQKKTWEQKKTEGLFMHDFGLLQRNTFRPTETLKFSLLHNSNRGHDHEDDSMEFT